ncbi:transmembrane protein 14C-like protein [Radiomyces spectabilis]|uniref:transmembrane protein 14C-like protein n=1 Tax=Radiomyces spectabilis TaxID=64574 RepID=UPI00221F020C|nr:transmembrane protein 14C-like protein [Radiomyces spectabilis]KAI8365280.1 transmembrane protein 14C-like protein [Radiomyces spectabilis]
MTDLVGYIYSGLIFTGGAIGYFKAGSTASLLAGTIFSAAAGLGAYLASNNPKNVVFALLVAVVLLMVMGSRFSKSGKFMPAGLISFLSLLMIIRYGLRLIQ